MPAAEDVAPEADDEPPLDPGRNGEGDEDGQVRSPELSMVLLALQPDKLLTRCVEEVTFVDHAVVHRSRVLTINPEYTARDDRLEAVPVAVTDRFRTDTMSLVDDRGRRVACIGRRRERLIVRDALFELVDLAVLESVVSMDDPFATSDETAALFRSRLILREEIERLIGPDCELKPGATAKAVEQPIIRDMARAPELEEAVELTAFFALHEIVLVRPTDGEFSSVYVLSYDENTRPSEERWWRRPQRRTIDITVKGSADVASYLLRIVPPHDVVVEHLAATDSDGNAMRDVEDLLVRDNDIRSTIRGRPGIAVVTPTLAPRPTGVLRSLPLAFLLTGALLAAAALVVPGSAEPGRSIALLLCLAPAAAAVVLTWMLGVDPHPMAVRLLLRPRVTAWFLAALLLGLVMTALVVTNEVLQRLCLGVGAVLYLGPTLTRLGRRRNEGSMTAAGS